MNVSLRQLQVLQSVAVTRNFSRTGDQVGLTQPAVSRCITELETQLGLKLLNRTTREVGLTDAGHGLAARSGLGKLAGLFIPDHADRWRRTNRQPLVATGGRPFRLCRGNG